MDHNRRRFLAIAHLVVRENRMRAQSMPGGGALRRLMDGNARFAKQMAVHPDEGAARRFSLAMGQHPVAAVLTCADSRVPPELIFDQGLGDLFTIRVAGNIADDAVLASLEYAVTHLGVRLVMVLGHEKCGAVDAAVRMAAPEGHLATLLNAIRPVVEASRNQPGGDALDKAVRENVRLVVKKVRESMPVLAEAVDRGRLKLAGARYALATGVVELLT